MSKKIMSKIVSIILCICLLLSTWLQSGITTYAAGSVTNLVIDQNQVSGEYALNLTQVGDIDWLHLKGDGSNGVLRISKATTPAAISFNTLSNSVPEGKVSNGDADRVASTWTDGITGYESGTNDTGFAVLLPPAGSRGAGTCSENVGWNFSVAAQPVETSVIFTVGLWQSVVDVKFYMDGTQVDTKNISAGGGALTYKYQVTVPANKVLKVEGIQTYINSNDGNSSISNIAVGTTATQGLNIIQNQVFGQSAIDLSFAGNVDWLHLKGDGNLVQIKKATSQGTISFGTLSNTGSEGKPDNGDPDRMAYTWNDGMAGYASGSNDTGFGVFFPTSNRGPATWGNDVGCTFSITAQPQETTVVFGLGLWQSKVDVKFYMNDILVDTKNISAGGTSQTFKYQVTVPANAVLKVDAIQKETLSQWGNFSLSGIAVSREITNDKTALQNLYNQVKDVVQGSYTVETWTVFDNARIAAKAVIADPAAIQTGIDSAKIALEQAQSALEKNTNGLIISQNQVSGVYAIDLTAVGNVDWLHLKGNSSKEIIQIKKNSLNAQNAITLSALTNTIQEGKETNGDSNRAVASWTDGMAGYESLSNDTGFGVFLPLSDDRAAGANKENVGWNFTVAAQTTSTTVIFSTGIWQAKVNVNFYLDDQYIDTKIMDTGNNAQVYKYQVVVPANKVLKVVGLQTYKNGYDGNSSLSNIAVSNVEIADKSSLQAIYDEFSGITQIFFTDASWQNFIASKAAAKAILDKTIVTQTEVNDAKAALILAQSNLVKKVTNVMIDYTGGKKVFSYALGHLIDQQDRYQTFTASEDFKMEYVQVGLYKNSADGYDLLVKLYATDSNGLPTGTALAETTVSKTDIIENGLTTAKLSYDIVKNTRYAIDVTQSTLKNGMYNWIVMPKNYYTTNEFYGKTVSGSFVPEAWLGTGLLKVIKQLSVDRSLLEALVSEVSKYNDKLYTVESWLTLVDALESAKNCLNNFDASQVEIDAENVKLQAAKDNLVTNIVISDFNSFISNFDNMVVKGYTDASVAVLTGAVANAKLLDSSASDNQKLQAYIAVLNAISQLQVSGKYSSETDGGLTGSFGFESDMNAPIAYVDGSFRLKSRGNLMVRFGVTGLKEKGIAIDWYNRDGYLPCYVSEYTVDGVSYKIEEFANKHTIDGNPVEVAYAKMTAINNSGEKRLLPVVSKELVPLNNAAEYSYIINAGETVVREYAIKADRFENEGHTGERYDVEPKAPFPADQKILDAAKAVSDIGANSIFENNYAAMKTYWDNRLAGIIDIKMPNSKDVNNKDSLVNAYKAGYIYTLLIKDNTFLHIGENGYDRLFSHDTIGVLQSLITAGDFKDAKNYLESVPMTGGINIENGEVDPDLYWDANWKLPWAYSVYLSKTGDLDFVKEKYEGVIKKMAHSIHDDRTGANHDGIMKSTLAIDTYGQWTVDDQAALMGLVAYKYICNELAIKEIDPSKKDYYLAEVQWANAEYDSLLQVVTTTLENTINNNNLNYIPASIVQPNTQNRCNDIRDGNWASMLLFGSFPWDGYLYGADQSKAGANIDMIDKTYAYGIDRRKDLPGASPYNFGGYPHGWYSSAYNAGYGIAALRGEAYRDIGIKAYEFAINSAMSSPFGWWEGVGPGGNDFPTQDPTSPLWSHDNASGGGGSNQHMWGQATASKVLYDAFIAERIFNDNKNAEIIIGRGIPKEWVKNSTIDNNVIASVENYPVLQGGRVGYTIERYSNKLSVKFTYNMENSKVDPSTAVQMSVELPSFVNNIVSASVGTIDNINGIVKVPGNTAQVDITLADLGEAVIEPLSINATSLQNGKVDSIYSAQLAAVGGVEPYTWSATGLPAGLSITTSGKITGTPTIAGTYSVIVTAKDSAMTAVSKTFKLIVETKVTHTEEPTNTSTPQQQQTEQKVIVDNQGNVKIEVQAKKDEGKESATTVITADKFKEAIGAAKADSNGIKTIGFEVPKLVGVNEYRQVLPTEIVTGDKLETNLIIETAVADITIPNNMLRTAGSDAQKSITLSVAFTDSKGLDNSLKTLIGNRPVLELRMMAGDKVIEWNNPDASVKVSIDYKATAEELKNPEYIVVYYIDGKGNAIAVPSGKYDAKSGKVTFTTTHFSTYAIAYEKKSFSDTAKYKWAVNAIEVLASEGIAEGVTNSEFMPAKEITRGEFIGWLVKTLGLTAQIDGNFKDVSKSYKYYQEIGAAKILGITSGVGGNIFNPEKEISRQDMMVLTVKALKKAGKQITNGSQKDIKKFTDASKVSKYALESVVAMVKNGLIAGSENKINPTANITRAEASVVLYKIYSQK